MGSQSTSKALYRKYRGLSFDEIVGQEHITDVLTRAVETGRISHAYLFTGPRGTGKTSVARILAHVINGLEYTHEDTHIDIIEIDAASNRRIDEIRDLREKSHIAPVSAKYKVYIIDEVHMLTKEAFNALLKTLEEPPGHVVFILATTEVHKLPQTIISRTQRHTFKPVPLTRVADHLRSIAKQEKIAIDDEALAVVAAYGEGSFRDAIGLLDQVAGLDSKTVTKADVEGVLGLADSTAVNALLEQYLTGNNAAVIAQLGELTNRGTQPEQLALQIVEALRKHDSYYEHLDLAEELISVPSHAQPSLKLELALLAPSGPATQPLVASTAAAEKTIEPTSKPAPAEPLGEPVPEKAAEEPVETVPTPVEEPPEPTTHTSAGAPASSDDWNGIISIVKAKNNAIASILRNSNATIEDAKINIGVRFGFHKKKLEDTQTASMVKDAIKESLGRALELEVFVDAAAATQQASPAAEEADTSDRIADSIIETFGGGERVNL